MKASRLRPHGAPRSDPSGEHEVNELGNHMLQIVFALLSLLLIASAILMMKHQKELSQAKQEASTAKQQAEEAEQSKRTAELIAEQANQRAEAEEARRRDIEQTDQGQAYVALERIKLEKALETIKRKEHVDLGLELFVDPTGQVKMEDLVLTVLRQDLSESTDYAVRHFAAGCRHAQEHYATRERRRALQDRWYVRAMELAELPVHANQASLSDENAEFLRTRIAEMVVSFDEQCRLLHEEARSALLDHYERNPSLVQDQTVTARLQDYTRYALDSFGHTQNPGGDREALPKPSVEQQQLMFRGYVTALNDYVFRVFQDSGAPLLKAE